ncbi:MULTISPECIES: hypothetical protein [Amycolatopsis]|uniref:hypothetical protein n=1 Tax=Amycolatopsis TaxID=1813 RepID=UPI000B8A8A97|nr:MULTISPECIES: hypothetical protein [Amycolatopsis]OXM70728.1 hypothetical protein CF166_20530 [Amycolatopsis sp. KNN50.9b]
MGKKSNMIPLPSSGGSILPKLIGGLVILATLAIVIKRPSDAATWVRAAIGSATDAIDGVATFFRQVAS